jgi:hypothetical protein
MGKKSLSIVFLVGLGIFGIPAIIFFSGMIRLDPVNITMIPVPMAIGLVIMVLSGKKLLRRFGNYLDRD